MQADMKGNGERRPESMNLTHQRHRPPEFAVMHNAAFFYGGVVASNSQA
jgi:hypothetical protein